MVCFLLIRDLSFLFTLVVACQLVAHPVGSSHGMRNELYLAHEMALDRLSWYANFFDAKTFPYALAAGNKPIREYREVAGSRQVLLALVIYSEGDGTVLKSFRYVADSSLASWWREERERQRW
jgi:hypothetical protein